MVVVVVVVVVVVMNVGVERLDGWLVILILMCKEKIYVLLLLMLMR